jgi:hypothetical protein
VHSQFELIKIKLKNELWLFLLSFGAYNCGPFSIIGLPKPRRVAETNPNATQNTP